MKKTKSHKKGKILWLTGLSGSGKSTLSKKLCRFFKRKKYKVCVVDGDSFRKKNKVKNSFTKKNIINNNTLIINYLKKKHHLFDFLIVSVISPLKQTRIKAKKIFSPYYYEIFVNCSHIELQRRDTKNLYKLANSGKIKNLIGYKSKIKYEKTKYRKIVVDTHLLSKKQSLSKILKGINLI
tara:strand:- start:410 stop:952 length:543 start_codon:yes stop_codon:yes gene_type:complete